MSEEHMFQPFVTLTLREDGRYDVDIDFGDSYLGQYGEDGWEDPGTDASAAACAAVDQWVLKMNKRFIIEPAATYHGITKAECLTCGYTARNPRSLEMWNDYGVVCLVGEHPSGSTRWTLVDGTVTVTTQDAEGNLTTTTTTTKED